MLTNHGGTGAFDKGGSCAWAKKLFSWKGKDRVELNHTHGQSRVAERGKGVDTRYSPPQGTSRRIILLAWFVRSIQKRLCFISEQQKR